MSNIFVFGTCLSAAGALVLAQGAQLRIHILIATRAMEVEEFACVVRVLCIPVQAERGQTQAEPDDVGVVGTGRFLHYRDHRDLGREVYSGNRNIQIF